MWLISHYYRTIIMAMTSISSSIFVQFQPELVDTTVYKFPNSRIAATNAIIDDSFSGDYLFGVGTSAFQVEGAWNQSDKSPSIWDDFTHNHSELIDDRENADVAADSYHNYVEDIELAKNLGAKAYRISLSWSRILPDGFANRISISGVQYYNNMINEMIRQGITPVVTLYHWDIPQRLQDIGGWTNPLIVDWFVDYAWVAFDLFGDRVKIWSTMNEPVVFCTLGYGGKYAPLVEQPGVADYLCGHYALIAHAKVYRMYGEEFRQKQNGKVGIDMAATWAIPEDDWKEEHVEAAERYFQFWNGWLMHPIFHPNGDYPLEMRIRVDMNSIVQGFPKSRLPVFTAEEIAMIKDSADFLGINYHAAKIVRPRKYEAASISYFDDMGSEPIAMREDMNDMRNTSWAFERLLHEFNNRYKIPKIYIIDSGYDDQGALMDIGRAKYYYQNLLSLLKVMHCGINVRGYIVWSLIDGFDWVHGYRIRTGLFSVDFADPKRKRTPKFSSEIVTAIYKSMKIPKIEWPDDESSMLSDNNNNTRAINS